MATKDGFETLEMRREREDSGPFQVDAAASSEQLGERQVRRSFQLLWLQWRREEEEGEATG